MLTPLNALLLAGLISTGQGQPSHSPVRIVDNPQIECLVNRGAYCIPDTGLSLTIYSSDSDDSIIIRVVERYSGSELGYVIENGSCGALARRPVFLRRGAYSFEGRSWQSAEFRINSTCHVRLLGPPAGQASVSPGSILSVTRPCLQRSCRAGSLLLLLPEYAPRNRRQN